MKEIEIEGLTIKYTKDYITICNSYRIKKKSHMIKILIMFLVMSQYQPKKRFITSWVKEWTAHNRLYRLGLFRSHTRDCDLEENEKWYRLLIYEILGF